MSEPKISLLRSDCSSAQPPPAEVKHRASLKEPMAKSRAARLELWTPDDAPDADEEDTGGAGSEAGT
eukprot:CAMPEP_0177390182 /NCGR_PEP_ID=MMETSP0368-20130122/53021_1 /TAXON_ID=447022 ORGANISM="Scrippsiella hangoei-like, Strain SHHI-4" /NCGR_SAMPLE_ID=MMETSP0368 /ASSEMBLY_ACC=CAM_ASM_000363 /LENGTH=66 /DNA_ID=CAMNT_0018855761 /DNA_START=167 /DNA_END=364 /DNA_ORIENTATION=+